MQGLRNRSASSNRRPAVSVSRAVYRGNRPKPNKFKIKFKSTRAIGCNRHAERLGRLTDRFGRYTGRFGAVTSWFWSGYFTGRFWAVTGRFGRLAGEKGGKTRCFFVVLWWLKNKIFGMIYAHINVNFHTKAIIHNCAYK